MLCRALTAPCPPSPVNVGLVSPESEVVPGPHRHVQVYPPEHEGQAAHIIGRQDAGVQEHQNILSQQEEWRITHKNKSCKGLPEHEGQVALIIRRQNAGVREHQGCTSPRGRNKKNKNKVNKIRESPSRAEMPRDPPEHEGQVALIIRSQDAGGMAHYM